MLHSVLTYAYGAHDIDWFALFLVVLCVVLIWLSMRRVNA